MYLVGEPILYHQPHGTFHAPFGQLELCQGILAETDDPQVIRDHLCGEYLAIIYALKTMGIEFRIIFSHEDQIDKGVMSACAAVGCRFIKFAPEFFPPSVIFPRDFSTVLPGLILLNSTVMKPLAPEKDGWALLSSALGEGGRVLYCKDALIVSQRICTDGPSEDPEHLEVIASHGVRTALFPPPVVVSIGPSGSTEYSFNDHIDRVACMIEGTDGKKYLLVDPGLRCIVWHGRLAPRLWSALSAEGSIDLIRERCAPLGIEVVVTPPLAVPYALNLLQFSDGRVLMTSGDDGVAKVVKSLILEHNLVVTPTPIRYLPVWRYAGIRCLVSEAPMPIIKKANPTS